MHRPCFQFHRAPVDENEPRFCWGLVVARLGIEESKSVSNIVLAGTFEDTNHELFIIPRYVFTKEHLQATYKDISKSRLSKLQDPPGLGEEIHFTVKNNEGFVIDRCEPEMKGRNIYEVTPMGERCLEIYFHGTISNERVRRFHCPYIPNLHVPQKILQVNIPNVPYFFAVRVNVDLGQYKAHQPPEECRPTIDIKFHMIMFPSPKLWMDTDREAMPLFEEAMRMVNSTPWNLGRFFPEPNGLYPRMFLPYSNENLRIHSPCIILSLYEVYVTHRPNQKALVAFIYLEDYTFIEGRTIWGNLYYCRYNEAYILYKYEMTAYPDPAEHPELYAGTNPERLYYDQLHCSEENPMETRMKDGHKEFLGYIKLNRLNHFFCSYAIRLIDDPRKITHGHFQLGEQKDPEYDHEFKQMVGQRAWLRYLPNKKGIKWEVSEMFKGKADEEEGGKIEHKSFISHGLKLDKKEGLVYCPSVCNFPLHLGDNLLNDPGLDVGDWFRFEAKFDEDRQCYLISRIVEMVTPRKYPVMRLAGQEDVYAFKIPLYSNYDYTRNLLMNDEAGFIEDIDCHFINFIGKWEETHRTRGKNGKLIQLHVDVWCHYNPNLADRQTPLCCLDINDPEGFPYPPNHK